VEFNDAVEQLVLGPGHRARGAPAPCALRKLRAECGALRVGAELIRAAAPKSTVYVSDPTWGNHMPLLGVPA